MKATGRLGMRLKEMMQHMEKRADMLAISPALRLTYIIYDDVANCLGPVRPTEQILCICGSCDLRQMLMLCDCEHFLLGKSAKGYAILQRDHYGATYQTGSSLSCALL
jgi:hypothetical protein